MIKNSWLLHNAMRDMVSKRESNGEESVWFDNPQTEAVETFDDIIVGGFKDAVAQLEEDFGNDVNNWEWGKLHVLTFNHPFGTESALMGALFNIGPFPYSGSIYTVNLASYPVGKSYEPNLGPSERYIFDLSDMSNSLRCIPGGISGNFMSPHYDDQAEMFVNVEYRPFVLDKETVEEDAKYELTMVPEVE